VLSGTSLVLSVLARDHFWLSYAFLCLAIPGPFAALAPFWAIPTETMPHGVFGPVIGLANPVAPPVRVAVVEGEDGRPEIRGLANFGFAYEGPPTCVHGGVIAELLDEVLGAANIVAEHAAMTGTLTVRYRSPTPLNTDLRVEARFVRQEGRKIFAWGGVYHGDVLTAEAEGLFIEVRPKQMLTIAEANVDSVDPGMLDAIRAEALREGAASDVQRVVGSPATRAPDEPE